MDRYEEPCLGWDLQASFWILLDSTINLCMVGSILLLYVEIPPTV